MADISVTDFLGSWAKAIKARLPAEKLEPEFTLNHAALTTAPAVIDGVAYNGTITKVSSNADTTSYWLKTGDNFRFAIPFTYVNSSPPVSCRAYSNPYDIFGREFNCTMEVNHSKKTGVLYPYFSNNYWSDKEGVMYEGVMETNDYDYNTHVWTFLILDVSFAENAEYKAKTFELWEIYLRKWS